MTETAEKIAAGLERGFSARGFAEPGVDALRAETGVSLRTLYKHFPSREAMVIGALDHRHAHYLDWLADGMPAGPGVGPVLHVYRRLGAWMTARSPTGCLFVNALNAHPESIEIRRTVERHKAETRDFLAETLDRAVPDLSDAARAATAEQLLLIHEGQTAQSLSRGPDAATQAAEALAGAVLASLATPRPPKETDR